MRKWLTQRRINIFNFCIALGALILTLPGAANQVTQFIREQSQPPRTNVVYFSPPEAKAEDAIAGEMCWGSGVSGRSDAYRCTSSKALDDPCFVMPQYWEKDKTFFYCPESEEKSTGDRILKLDEANIDRSYVQDGGDINPEKDLPWLIVFADGAKCRLHTGASDIAYGSKGNIYGCKSDRYLSVTTGKVSDGKHSFDCKLKGETIFTSCVAKLIAY